MSDDQTLVVLRAILDELRAIRGALQIRQLPSADLDLLTKLLPAIGGTWGSDPFTVKELLSNPVLKALSGSFNSHKLGNLFARSVNQDVAGLRLERLSTEHSARLWRVVRG